MSVEQDTGKSGKSRNEQWDECSRCGFVFPLSELVIQQGDRGGMIVCIYDFDEPASGDYKQRDLPVEPPLKFIED